MTESLDCWILPHETAGGPENMAKDEALLDFAASHPDQAIFRTYEWSEPTLSLGYFQSIRSVEADGRWKDAPAVRRLSGGGALWHDRELTYALIVPPNHPLSLRSARLYELVHEAIIQVLARDGLIAARRGIGGSGPNGTEKPFLCFLDHDSNDVVFRGRKLVGSAQRRRSGAVLQHGSILLEQSPRTPELPGIMNLAVNQTPIADWTQRLETDLPEALHLRPRRQEWPRSIVDQADSLIESRYQDDAWNRRR